MTTRSDPRYAGYRHPAEIIAAAVRLDFRFPLSLRMVEALPAARGITASDGTVRRRARKFGPEIAPGCADGRRAGATSGISTRWS